jgi:hypothetical protein
VYYDPLFLTADEAERAYAELWHQTPWQTTAKINRWVCLMEDDRNHRHPVETGEEEELEETETSAGKNAASSPYRYRDAPDRGGSSLPFTDLVRDLAQRASIWYEQKNHCHDETTKHADDNGPSSSSRPPHFNVCLLNFYENGTQRIGWHCDREEIGRSTPIAAISLGATRSFHLRSQNDGFRDRAVLSLTSGSLLVMENVCQTSYLHAVPREPHVTTGRINLTFRCKEEMDRTAGEEIHARRDEWLQSIVAGVEPDDNMYRTTGRPDDAAALREDDNVVFGDTASTTMPTTQRHDDATAAAILPVIQFIVTTNLGAESYCAAELMELLQGDCGDNDDAETMVVVAMPLGLHGCVAVCCGAGGGGHHQHDEVIATAQRALLQSRSAHHILRYHTHFSLNDLTDDTGYPLWKDIPAERLYAHIKAELEARRLHIFSTTVRAADVDDNDNDNAASAAATSFRVSCERMGGPHAFASHQVELYVLSGLVSAF